MKRWLVHIAILSAPLFGSLSCSLSEDPLPSPGPGHSVNNVVEATVWGTPAELWMILDNGDRLIVVENKVVGLAPNEPIDGRRMLVSYTILSWERVDGKVVCRIRLNDMRPVDP